MHEPSDGIPTCTDVHHVGITVPDLDAAVSFFTDVLGGTLIYEKGPFGDSEGDTMERRLGVHPRASAKLAMIRCGPSTNVELFEWDAPDQSTGHPKNSDVGAAHLAFAVEDIETATAYLREQPDVTVLDEPQTNDSGPTAGLTYVYADAPWGLSLELVELPDRLGYEDDTDERLAEPATSWEK